jgi:hypothetical protein
MKGKLVKLANQTLKRRIDRGILIIKWVLITMLLELKRTHNCFNFRAWHFPPISYISSPKNLCFWSSFPNGVLANIWTFGIQHFGQLVHSYLQFTLFWIKFCFVYGGQNSCLDFLKFIF